MSGIVNDIAIPSSRYHPEFAVGTKMVFNQTAAPTGWTKVTSSNDVALRLVSGSVGTGGSVAFETAFASQTPTISQPTASSGAVDVHVLAVNELPSHLHYIQVNTTSGSAEIHKAGSGSGAFNASSGAVTVSHGGSHVHAFTQPTISQPTSSAINLDVSYVDVIISTKD